MTQYLLDTCILSHVLRGWRPAVKWFEGLNFKMAGVSTITVAELHAWKAAIDKGRLPAINGILDLLEIYDVDIKTAIRAGEIRWQRNVKLPDALIIATAQTRGLTLFSGDKALPDAILPYETPSVGWKGH